MDKMMPTCTELDEMSDDDVRARFNNSAKNQPDWYLVYRDELHHRELRRHTQEMAKHTKAVTWLTVVIAVATLIQLALVLESAL
jgi:hypothetical protein